MCVCLRHAKAASSSHVNADRVALNFNEFILMDGVSPTARHAV